MKSNNYCIVTRNLKLNQSRGLVNYSFKRTMSTLPEIKPKKIYLNADKEKDLIISDNKNRTGIYR